MRVRPPHLLREVVARARDVADNDVGQQVARLVGARARAAAPAPRAAAKPAALAGLLDFAACADKAGLRPCLGMHMQADAFCSYATPTHQ